MVEEEELLRQELKDGSMLTASKQVVEYSFDADGVICRPTYTTYALDWLDSSRKERRRVWHERHLFSDSPDSRARDFRIYAFDRKHVVLVFVMGMVVHLYEINVDQPVPSLAPPPRRKKDFDPSKIGVPPAAGRPEQIIVPEILGRERIRATTGLPRLQDVRRRNAVLEIVVEFTVNEQKKLSDGRVTPEEHLETFILQRASHGKSWTLMPK